MPNDLLEQERNPAQKSWEDTRDSASSPVEPTSDTGGIANNIRGQTADPSQENRNIAAMGEQSPTSSSGGNQSSSKSEATANLAPKSKRDKALTFIKKITPFTVLLGIFLVSMGGLLLINIPALVLVQIKEGAMGDMFDSLSVAELRTAHIFRAKTKPHPALANGCTKISVRCNFKTLSDNQMKKLRVAGLSTDPVDPKKNPGGRYKVNSLTYTDKSGQTRSVSSRDFNKQYRTNAEFRSRVNQAYNPKWKMLRDGAATKVLSKYNVSLKRLVGGSKKAMRATSEQFLRKGVGSDVERTGINQSRKPPTDDLDESQHAQKVNQEIEARNQLSKMSNKSSGFKSMLKGGARAANVLTGAQAQACAVIKSIEIAGTASRIIKHAELLRLAVLVYNVADSIPYGEATYEAVEFAGKFVTSVDLQEKVLNENSFGDGDIVEAMGQRLLNEEEPQLVDNPDYGKSPTESVGQKASLYGSVGNLSMRDSQYVMGSGFQGSLKSLTDYLRTETFGSLDKKACAFYENLAVQTGGLLLSLAGVIGTGGSGAAAAGIKIATQMAAFSFITSYINGVVSDMLTGEAVSMDLKGVDAGNALFAGGGAFYGAMSSSRGLTPVSTDMEVRNMQAMRTDTIQQQAHVARFEARSEPLNIYNQYSFLGSIVWSLDPSLIQSLSRAGLVLQTPNIILGSLTSLLSPKARAATISDEARFSKCQDPAFVGGGIRNDGSANDQDIVQSEGIGLNKADMMCNPRYSIDPMHSNADPERVADWMIDAGQIDNKTGEQVKDQPAMASIYNTARDDSQIDSPSPRDGAPIAPEDVKLPPANMNDEEAKDYLDKTKGRDLSLLQSNTTTSTDQAIADVLRPDDQTLADLGIPIDTPSSRLVAYTPGYQAATLASAEQNIIKNNQVNGEDARYLPPPIGADASAVNDENYEPVKDVRTYAHWLRFCRFGDEEGRSVQIGDGDALEDKTGFTKLLLSGIEEEYVSDGRECLKSNTCTPKQDPNGTDDWSRNIDTWNGEKAMRNRCRPPQYDIYSVYHIDKSIEDGLEADDTTSGDDATNSNLADGDARDLARQLADHKELTWQNGDTTPNLLREFADKGSAINSCGEQFQVDKLMLQVMLKQLDTYTIVANNIGFSGDRSMCDGGMHPKGKAIDINQISAREGPKKGSKTGPTITFGSGQEVDLITQFAIDWMDAAGTVDKKAGRSGQIGCGGYNLLSKRKPEWEGADGNLHFSDACNHLHIDVGQR